MSIQRRFLLALALLLLGSVLVLVFGVQEYMAPRVLRWESGQARTQVDLVRHALEREAEHLGVYVREWGVWDDTYLFIQQPDPGYIRDNLQAGSFRAARVDLLAFVNQERQLTWGGFLQQGVVDPSAAAALVSEIMVAIPARTRRGPLRMAGLMETRQGLMVVAVHSIHDSMELQPAAGLVIGGRLLDSEFLDRLRQQTGLDLDVTPIAGRARLVGGPGSGPELPEDGTPVQSVLSPSSVQLLAVFRDLAARPILLLRVNVSRAVFTEARELLTYTLLGTMALFLLTLSIAGLALRRMVFLPIADLARHAFEVHHSGDYSRRLDYQRNDEIGKLAREFDELLAQIDTQAQALKKLSFEDALTGLRNRRSFDEQLRSAWSVLQRSGQPLSLMVLDVDDFKRYNDHYGHPQGDEALRAVAGAMRSVLRRAGDTVARYGGEEFAAVMPGTSREDALILGERVRQAVIDLGLPHATSQVAPTLSVTVGVASVHARGGLGEEVVLRMADEALYCAKRGGKNRVHVAEEPAADAATGSRQTT